MATRVKIQLDDEQRILLKRKLDKNGQGQVYFTRLCEKTMNDYVPFLTGNLKDNSVEIGRDFIKYKAPYARKQYYSNRGLGKQGVSLGGLRGRSWDKRMWVIKGRGIVEETAKFCGGRAE